MSQLKGDTFLIFCKMKKLYGNFSNKENAAIFMFPVNPLNSGDL